MATVFRATTMLLVLVGLPSAWVYYGPLPPAAMGVIERTINSAKQSLGWSTPSMNDHLVYESPKTAPRFDGAVSDFRDTRLQTESALAARSQPPVVRDSQFALASATVPIASLSPSQTFALDLDSELAKQLEPHLSLLRSLDAEEYTLENWGGSSKLYRFRCAIALGENADHTRQFEAVHEDPLRAVHQVVGEVTSWQNARRLDGVSRWQ